jgi:hypothetical protein
MPLKFSAAFPGAAEPTLPDGCARFRGVSSRLDVGSCKSQSSSLVDRPREVIRGRLLVFVGSVHRAIISGAPRVRGRAR